MGLLRRSDVLLRFSVGGAAASVNRVKPQLVEANQACTHATFTVNTQFQSTVTIMVLYLPRTEGMLLKPRRMTSLTPHVLDPEAA